MAQLVERVLWELIVSLPPAFPKTEKNGETQRKTEKTGGRDFSKIRFDHLSDPNWKKIILYRGVAQLVGRVPWEHQAVGSNPATPTTKPPVTGLESLLPAYFLFLIQYCFYVVIAYLNSVSLTVFSRQQDLRSCCRRFFTFYSLFRLLFSL